MDSQMGNRVGVFIPAYQFFTVGRDFSPDSKLVSEQWNYLR